MNTINIFCISLWVICWLPNYLAIRFILSSMFETLPWTNSDRINGIGIAFPLGPLGLFLVAGALLNYILSKRSLQPFLDWFNKPARW